jgi:hypothetical protein
VSERIESGKFSPRIDRIFTLSEIVDAHRYMEENQQIGKIVVTVGHGPRWITLTSKELAPSVFTGMPDDLFAKDHVGTAGGQRRSITRIRSAS